MIIQNLIDRKLISPPSWMKTNLVYVTIMGSQAYGTSIENSDLDLNGICIPPKNYIFPHLNGCIQGFGTLPPKFEQYQQHHIKDDSSKKEYDVTITSIVKVFNLAMQGNPNIIDMLFVPDNCLIFSSIVGNIIRENRKLFLTKKIWPRYKGYSYSQLKHLDNKNPIGKRKIRVEQQGYDTKFASHLVRLLNFAQQILIKGDLDLQENNEQLKAIRRGEWTEDQVRKFFTDKENQLEKVFLESKIPNEPDETKIKSVLIDCLEAHYGDLSNVVVRQNEADMALQKIEEVLESYKKRNNHELYNQRH